MLGEPHQVETEGVEPRDLIQYLRVESLTRNPGVRRVPEVVDDAQPEGKGAQYALDGFGGWMLFRMTATSAAACVASIRESPDSVRNRYPASIIFAA